MDAQKSITTSQTVRMVLANVIYLIQIIAFLYCTTFTITLGTIIAPIGVFIALQTTVLLIQRRLPCLHQVKNFLPAHILLLFESAFITLDLAGAFYVYKVQIFMRIMMLLVQFMMVRNILRILEEGYGQPEHLLREVMLDNSEYLLYYVIVATFGSIEQFFLYGDSVCCDIMIWCIVALLFTIIMEFCHAHGLFKIFMDNISHF